MYLQEENVFLKLIYSMFLVLFDNYMFSILVIESQDVVEWIEIDVFLDVILVIDVMNYLYNFLVEYGDYYIYYFQVFIIMSWKVFVLFVNCVNFRKCCR